MSRLQKSIVIVLLFALSACSQKPIVPSEAPSASFTPYLAGTETALAMDLASPTPWVAGTETALAVVLGATPTPEPSLPPFPTFTPGLPPFPTFTPFPLQAETFSPVFYGSGSFLLLGGIKTDHGWLSGIQAAQFIGAEMEYDFFNPNGVIQLRGSALEYDPICRNHFMPSTVTLPEPMVGVASGWITEKRAIQDLSTDDPIYVQAVTDWFQSQGNSPTEIHITRILQTDIEGDGVDEVLLSASYFKDKSFTFLTETGDYSVVLMRKVVGDQVFTIPLVGDYYVSSVPNIEISYPHTYTLAEAVDLNRDGTLEVIVDVRRWEGWGAIVYRVDGQNVREVMRTIC